MKLYRLAAIVFVTGVMVATIGSVLISSSGIISCGGGINSSSTEVTETTLNDGDGTPMNDPGSTPTDPTVLIITFPGPMDQDSVTTPGHITLTCGDHSPSIQVVLAPNDAADGVVGNEYMLSIEDAYAYQLLECTLTITSDVMTVIGEHLATPIVYTYTNPCAVSDDFNADSSECWQVHNDSTWSSWSDLKANIFSFDTPVSQLIYSTVGLSGYVDDVTGIIYKGVSVDETGFEIILKASASGIDDNGPDGSPDVVALFLCHNPGIHSTCYGLGFFSAGGAMSCGFLYTTDGATTDGYRGDICDGETPYYFRMRGENNSVGAQYSTDGVTYSDLVNRMGSFPTVEDFSAFTALNMVFRDQGYRDDRAQIDSVIVSNVTVEGQY